MTTAAVFTLSLDCEGLWGMADQEKIVRGGDICQKSLQDAYGFIRRILDRNQVPATCAFVSAFAVGRETLRQHSSLLQELAASSPSWFTHILPAVLQDHLDGWTGDEFYRDLHRDGHEMAWHGATHLSLANSTPDAAVELELLLAQRLFEVLGERPRTIVFPRNDIGHLPRLLASGFTCYRAGSTGHVLDRLGQLARELNVRDRGNAETPYTRDGWLVSPPGWFLNRPKGVRSLVPVAVTISRWRSMLNAAVADGKYVHMWFHPHNLITGPAMRDAFEAVMAHVGDLTRTGDLVALTMDSANRHFGLDRGGRHAA
jgi:peptidoglycan/xylan/chitin deacetylase (PgdA/CDA1 family)